MLRLLWLMRSMRQQLFAHICAHNAHMLDIVVGGPRLEKAMRLSLALMRQSVGRPVRVAVREGVAL